MTRRLRLLGIVALCAACNGGTAQTEPTAGTANSMSAGDGSGGDASGSATAGATDGGDDGGSDATDSAGTDSDSAGTDTTGDSGTDGGGPRCDDGTQNGDESDVDCGGICMACPDGATCNEPGDCESGVCTDGVCSVPSFVVNEDFETGDFSRFPYAFDSSDGVDGHAWEIESVAAQCHGGQHCMRIDPTIDPDETVAISVPLSVREDTDVTFWVRTDVSPSQNEFRFYIDGIQQTTITGQTGWQLLSFPVSATGPGGPDRVLRWEYHRFAFSDPMPPSTHGVWIDDIDMPDWNTAPSTPDLGAPCSSLVLPASPTLEFAAIDPDLDLVVYEVEVDDDPSFSGPLVGMETTAGTLAPNLATSDTYYWRVRARDDIDERFSEWSTTASFELDTAALAPFWRQRAQGQFEENDLVGLETDGNAVVASEISTSTTMSNQAFNNHVAVNFGGTMVPDPGSARIGISGRARSATQIGGVVLVRVDGVTEGSLWTNNTQWSSIGGSVDVSHLDSIGTVEVFGNVDGVFLEFGSNWTFFLILSEPGQGTMVSEPIDIECLGPAATWQQVELAGTGDLRVRILDENGVVLPDVVVPNNSVGFGVGLQPLSIDATVYPRLRLEVTAVGGARLTSWTLVAQ